MEISPELVQAFSSAIASALQASVANVAAATNADTTSPSGISSTLSKPPTFSMEGYRSSDGTTVQDYFRRFDWSLQLSKIAIESHANFARVYMGTELNNALKFLVAPYLPEELSYDDIKTTLTNHFDRAKNKFAESIKFRRIAQKEGETIANFALRLRQGAAFCEYGEFLDRMLIEQLLHGLLSKEMCDEIIAKKPTTFIQAYEIANTLEATHFTADAVKATPASNGSEKVHRLSGRNNFKTKDKRHQRNRSASRGRSQQRDGYQISHGNKQTSNVDRHSCNGCGGYHVRAKCPFRDANCHICKRKGHIAKVCRSKQETVTTRQVTTVEKPAEHVDNLYRINSMREGNAESHQKRMLNVQIDGCGINMELDTGAPCSIISKEVFKTIKPLTALMKTDRQFASYTGHNIKCIGRVSVNAKIGSTTRELNLYVVEGKFDTLLGREWITQFAKEIDFAALFLPQLRTDALSIAEPCLSSAQEDQLNLLLTSYSDIFSDTPGKLIGPAVAVHWKSGIAPVFARAHEVPLALREAYAKEIDAKITSGFYEKVEYSEWASPTHVVVKKNGKLRITGNYKPTINSRMIIDEHPIPRINHLFNQMKGANLFCHLDITDAYTHLPVDDEFSHALTLNTPTHGLIRPKRAVYGAANIPAIWQRRMETVLQGLPNVINFFDDILVFADGFDNLLSTLDETLERIRSQGLKLSRSKCVFAAPSVEFLGHKIDANGIHKSDKHVAPIRDATKPSTREELQLFLGKATYYSSFIPNLSSRDRPLRDLLRVEPFAWTSKAEEAYNDIKATLTSPQVLMPYDPTLPLLLATDASKTGLGAVLSHQLSNGQERPTAYASRTMTATEQRYPQIDKEALAIVWAVQKFFHYLYARHFTLITDHKPLVQIFHPTKSLPVLCISRMANYADYLAHFNYNVIYKPTKANTNADYCSRVPLPATVNTVYKKVEEKDIMEDEFEGFIFNQITQLPIKAQHIATETRKDEHLGKIVQLLEQGQNLVRAGYKAPEANYSLAANCLLFEHRVVVPPTLRQAILNDLHAAHAGIVKMKGIARSFVYWPGIDTEIERIAKSCMECAKHAHVLPKFRDHHWEYPKGPWERVHIDYAGPVAGSMLLVIVDAYSKWLEVKPTKSTTTAATIEILDELFTTYGSPITVVSDNGPQFTSSEFGEFLKSSGIKFHKRTAPYHPATNGQAERYVQTVKSALNAMSTTASSLRSNLNEFLRQYRKAPHSTTGQTPAQLFLGRNIRTRIDLVRPDSVDTKVTEKQQVEFNTSFRTYQPEQAIYFLSGNPRLDKWIPGKVVTRLGDLHYEIDCENKKFKRHVDQMRGRLENEVNGTTNDAQPSGNKTRRRIHFYGDGTTNTATRTEPAATVPQSTGSQTTSAPMTELTTECRGASRDSTTPPALRRSMRIRQPPRRYPM